MLRIGYIDGRERCLLIEKGAFMTQHFKVLREIFFSNVFTLCIDPILTKDMLEGLENIRKFSIDQQTNTKISFEKNALAHMPIEILMIQWSLKSPEAIINITGSEEISSIIEIDFQFNKNIKTILNNSFIGVRKLVSLYLGFCEIENIQSNAFKGLDKLKLLTLTGNNLKHLSDKPLKPLNPGVNIYIKDNPWECSCSLIWIKQRIIKDLKETKCTKNDDSLQNLSDFLSSHCDNCSSTTITPTTTSSITAESSTTTKETTSTTTLKPTTSEIVPTTKPSISSTLLPTEDSQLHEFCSPPNTPSETVMQILKIDSTSAEISLTQNSSNLILIWIDCSASSEPKNMQFSRRSSNNRCQKLGNEKLYNVTNLKEDTSYVFCLLEKEKSAITPYNCTAAKTQLRYELQPFMLNKDIPKLIGGILGAIISVVTLAASIAYFVLSKYPKLLRNENVVVIDPHRVIKNPVSVLVSNSISDRPLPNAPDQYLASADYQSICESPNSIGCYNSEPIASDIPSSDTCSNYDRTLNHIYLSPIVRRKGLRSRASSFSGVSSGKDSYITVPEPNTTQLRDWRLRTWRKSKVNEVYHTDEAPPLPPPRSRSPYAHLLT